ncbi:hypothetical protein [Pseudokineococcus sp. 1T1Z-3]|uniref:hypothetical protein n=1 Tax=Pseudokineococcus sp. 1T1Z-3 TaxID=3132745 RepID=UPI0030AB69CF
MGLGGAPGEWAGYEWVRLADVPGGASTSSRAGGRRPGASALPPPRHGRPVRAGQAGGQGTTRPPQTQGHTQTHTQTRTRSQTQAPDRLGAAVLAFLDRDPLWGEGPGTRLLLADLDNLRAGPVRWRARMTVVAGLAAQADVVAISGQHGAAARGAPHLGRWAEVVRAVDDGSDLADHELLAVAAQVPREAEPLRVVVVSNDNIFADLAARGRLVVVSPGADALSERLDSAAADVVDLAALEGAMAAGLDDVVEADPR